MRHTLIILSAIVFLSSCRNSETGKTFRAADSINTVQFARGFKILEKGSSTVITVRNPWQHASGVEYTYILTDTVNSSKIISDYQAVIRTPVKNVICLSTTHIGFIGFLNKAGTVRGISGKNYVINDSIRRGISANQVFDVGYDESLNFEMILRLKPDIVFAYGVNVSVTNTVKKLNELEIPVILIGEYLEQDPLAKMEWVKVFAACYGLQDETNFRFNSVVNHYNKLKSIASEDRNKPSVLLGLPWRGTWYVSGGQSYIARLIADAGGSYIWRDMDFNESMPMGLEKIYENALTAEFWLNPGEARSKEDISSVDKRFGSLPAIKKDNVFNNDRQLSPTGGNAFYESGVVEPDIILSDLIFILHPHLLPSYNLKYYRKL